MSHNAETDAACRAVCLSLLRQELCKQKVHLLFRAWNLYIYVCVLRVAVALISLSVSKRSDAEGVNVMTKPGRIIDDEMRERQSCTPRFSLAAPP